MRIPGFRKRTLWFFVPCGFALMLAVFVCRAQGTNGTSDAVKDLLQTARETNGLTVPGVRPWRLKAIFERYDEGGRLVEQGKYEELWADPHQQKLVYASPSFSQVQYSGPQGRLVTGDHGDPPALLALIWWIATTPLPSDWAVTRHGMDLRKETVDGADADCLYERDNPAVHRVNPATNAVVDTTASVSIPPDSYCFDAQHLLVSFSHTVRGFSEKIHVSYRNPIQYDNRAIASDLELDRGGVPGLRVRVESLQPLEESDEAEFGIPTDAREPNLLGVEQAPVAGQSNGDIARRSAPSWGDVPGVIALPSGVAARRMSRSTWLIYPPKAKAAGIQGAVVLAARISKTGAVESLQIKSGPEPLRQAALNAVNSWIYRPYIKNGIPVEFETTINVVFKLENSPGEP